MNILEKNYPEISFKTDSFDVKVMIDFIDICTAQIKSSEDLKIKSAISILSGIHHKLTVKYYEKRSCKKEFIMKFKVYQIFTLYTLFAENNEKINKGKHFEFNLIDSLKNTFHQKLIGL